MPSLEDIKADKHKLASSIEALIVQFHQDNPGVNVTAVNVVKCDLGTRFADFMVTIETRI